MSAAGSFINTGICRHCHARQIARPRRLCSACYYRPAIRERYPVASVICNRRGSRPDFCGQAKLADMPTSALPGTPEKVAAMEERAALGLSLWHPRDAALPLQ